MGVKFLFCSVWRVVAYLRMSTHGCGHPRIKCQSPWARAPVSVRSGSCQRAAQRRLLKCGPTGIVSVPFPDGIGPVSAFLAHLRRSLSGAIQPDLQNAQSLLLCSSISVEYFQQTDVVCIFSLNTYALERGLS